MTKVIFARLEVVNLCRTVGAFPQIGPLGAKVRMGDKSKFGSILSF